VTTNRVVTVQLHAEAARVVLDTVAKQKRAALRRARTAERPVAQRAAYAVFDRLDEAHVALRYSLKQENGAGVISGRHGAP
jgi:hypothetical protein